jgi:hypothetical protein
MKSTCPVCGQEYRGIALNTVKAGKAVEVCPSCYKTLDAEYRKNSCYACVFFQSGACDLYGTELDEPYLQSATCEGFTTSKDPSVVAHAKERAEAARKHRREQHLAKPLSFDEAIAELNKKGQTLTYYCCHCGVPLKVGGSVEVQKTCPKCKNDLSVIALGKLISQHL